MPPRAFSLALFLAIFLLPLAARADDWPQWFGPQRDGVWRETGIVEKFPAGGPKVRWRATIGAGYAGPAVAGGKVYVHDRVLNEGQANPDDAFKTDVVNGKERVLCLDEAAGKLLWKHEHECPYSVSYPSGPRCTPLVAGGKVYTLGTMGNLLCLDAGTGQVVLVSRSFPRDYQAKVPHWGYSSHLLLDGQEIISLVGGQGSAVVAFDKDTGKEKWRALAARDVGYCPPMIFTAAGQRQLIIWLPNGVSGLDPATGKVHWTEKWAVNQNLTIPTPRLDGDRLLLSAFYNGSVLLDLKKDKDGPTAAIVWKGKHFKHSRGSEMLEKTDGLHSIMCTPVIKDGHFYGVCSYGHLRCVKADTGARVWDTLKATCADDKPVRWAHAFITPHADRYFLFNEKGDLIIAKLSPKGYDEISRARLLEADNRMPGRLVVWSHPAYANKCVFVRNDKEIVCASLAQE